MTLIVTASHAHADYNSLMQGRAFACTFAGDEKLDCYVSCVGGEYYAAMSLLGIGKDASSPEAAIRSLLADNGYTNIVIRSPEPTPPAGKPLAKSLHTVTVLVRVATLHLNKAGNAEPKLAAWIAINLALDTLGLKDAPDTYGLADQAFKQIIKQLNKGN